jgi:copper chaperone CopZ
LIFTFFQTIQQQYNMKNIVIFSLLTLAAFQLNAQQTPASASPMVKKTATSKAAQTAQLVVWGNCGMCKKTIETAAKSVAGVEMASWSEETHRMDVRFLPGQTGLDSIHAAIAAAGYDTDKLFGNDDAYKNLHSCCQYDRKPKN